MKEEAIAVLGWAGRHEAGGRSCAQVKLKNSALEEAGQPERLSEHHLAAEGKYTSPAAGAKLMPLAWVLGCAGVVSPASRPVLT